MHEIFRGLRILVTDQILATKIPNKKMANNNASKTASDADFDRRLKNISIDDKDDNATSPAPSSSGTQSSSDKPFEWFNNHPWANEAPPEGDPTIENIEPHKRYTVEPKWKDGKLYDLKKIVEGLPEFLNDMQQPVNNGDKSPHTPELLYTNRNTYQARSLTGEADQKECSVDVDGYMLKISIPTANKTFQILDESNKVCIPKPELVSNGDKRWIFIPSYLRASCALFDWKNTGIDDKNTTRIVVVRPDQYKHYIHAYCGHLLPIISLPEDTEGAGYARYWIQKIATEFGLPYIWMIDDSVKQFYEVHPDDKKDKEDKKEKEERKDKEVKKDKEERKDKEDKKDKEERKEEKKSYKGRERNFEKVFKEMEEYAKQHELAAISPARFRSGQPGPEAFTYKPPVGAVYLNIKAINEKGITYRPQLKVLEDVVFAAECVLKGKLRVGRFRRIKFLDVDWKNSGSAACV